MIILIKLSLFIIPFNALKQFKNHSYSTLVYDRNGYLLYKSNLKNGLLREFCPINEIPKSVQKAFIKAEDKRFYFHFGIDLISILRASVQNISSKRNISGASTITMQLARMVCPSNQRGIKAKLKDVINAFRIEAKLSKKQILELYLNNIPFGNNIEGISSAYFYFFGTELQTITDEQSYCLCVIPRNPEVYNPFKNPEKNAKAANLVAKKLISYDELYETSKTADKFTFECRMPHYIRYLQKKYPQDFANNSKLILSCDYELQQFCQNKLQESLDKAEDSRIHNGAVFVINAKTSEILAWIGSQSFYDDENGGQIDGILNFMQPGSSMKPFLYALALDNKTITPSSILADIPKEYGEKNLYIPSNFNNRFNGPIKTRVALCSSLNIPAVDILNTLGVRTYLDKLSELGFDSLKNTGEEYGLSLALGGGEVSLYELVPAFASFVRDGNFTKPVPLMNKQKQISNQVFSTDTARIICKFLSDKKPRALGFGFSQTFETQYPSIFKTGTSNQFQNITALGSTANYAVGVWMGNYDGHTVIGKTGSSIPAEISKSILDYLEKGNSPEAFNEPENYHLEKVCSLSGMKPSKFCLDTVYEYVENETFPETCNWHILKNDSINEVYPAEYQQWLKLYGNQTDFSSLDYSLNYNSMELTIQSPKQNAIYYYNNSDFSKHIPQIIPVEIFGGTEDLITVVYDDEKIKSLERPFSFTIPAEKGFHKIKVICGSETSEVEYEVK